MCLVLAKKEGIIDVIDLGLIDATCLAVKAAGGHKGVAEIKMHTVSPAIVRPR